MLQTIALLLAGLGIGIFSWLLMDLFAPRRIPDWVLSVLAVGVWLGIVWYQLSSGSSVGGFFIVAGICWVLDVIAGLALFVVVADSG